MEPTLLTSDDLLRALLSEASQRGFFAVVTLHKCGSEEEDETTRIFTNTLERDAVLHTLRTGYEEAKAADEVVCMTVEQN